MPTQDDAVRVVAALNGESCQGLSLRALTFDQCLSVSRDCWMKKDMDGVDLSGYLSGQTKELAERVLYWRFGEQRALRRGPWKYYGYMGEIELLFNLDEDPREERNVARDHPSVFDELRGLHAAWEAELVEPLWDVPMNTSVRAKALKQRYRLGTAGPR